MVFAGTIFAMLTLARQSLVPNFYTESIKI